MACVSVCIFEAYLVDTPDFPFDKGWVYRWEPWQDTLLDSLQDITDERKY